MTSATLLPIGDGDGLAERAQAWLEKLAGAGARLRDDQLSAITSLVVDGRRALVVQATGWGKSAVYWISTALLREQGGGPTVVVSPLLSLMRDQVEAAGRMGLVAVTMNSSNVDDWPALEARLHAGEVDVLLVSPERLNNPGFRERLLPRLAGEVGLLVIDEAHCISDWGHDFRPDYRRIRDLLAGLRPGVPVLATTATANARVTTDIAAQLVVPGAVPPLTLRGSLDRRSLALAVVDFADSASRYAWIADAVARLDGGSGIIYTLTVEGAQRLAGWLRSCGLAVASYTGQDEPASREAAERALKDGSLTALVATSALGMGFDHPTLSFVIHLGSPPNAIAYYQQVGRAGRALEAAVAVVLPEPADVDVWEWMTTTAMPPPERVEEVLSVLASAREPTSVVELERRVSMRRGRLEALLKVLDVEGAVTRDGRGWVRTPAAYSYDGERAAGIAAARRAEQDRMRLLLSGQTCLLQLVRRELDDTAEGDPGPCGRCQVCLGSLPAPLTGLDAPAEERRDEALRYLRNQRIVLPARARWPSGGSTRRGTIKPQLRPRDGRALAMTGDGSWEPAVRELLAGDAPVTDEVADGLIRLLSRWGWGSTPDLPRPTWIAPVPSRSHPVLLASILDRLASVGRLPVIDALVRAQDTPPQSEAANPGQAGGWALLALRLDPDVQVPTGPPLLIDDVFRTGWTSMVAGVLLAEAGADQAYPLALLRAR